jgi:hypothetical protein
MFFQKSEFSGKQYSTIKHSIEGFKKKTRTGSDRLQMESVWAIRPDRQNWFQLSEGYQCRYSLHNYTTLMMTKIKQMQKWLLEAVLNYNNGKRNNTPVVCSHSITYYKIYIHHETSYHSAVMIFWTDLF